MQAKDNSWISFSDMMTGLMVIFMFIAIAYIVEVEKEHAKTNQIFKDFKATKEALYQTLDSTFKEDFATWEVELDRDLSIKFTNPEVLFASGATDIRPYFQEILNGFLPKYFDILLQDQYKDKISEVRIEGHTDTVPTPRYDQDPYIGNVMLSQLRSANVLKYFRNMPYYQGLSKQKEQRLQFWLTANGLSFGRTLDTAKKLTLVSGKPVNNEYSRRVEFRIVTTSDQLIEEVLKKIKKSQ